MKLRPETSIIFGGKHVVYIVIKNKTQCVLNVCIVYQYLLNIDIGLYLPKNININMLSPNSTCEYLF